jgi:hypothetical protein
MTVEEKIAQKRLTLLQLAEKVSLLLVSGRQQVPPEGAQGGSRHLSMNLLDIVRHVIYKQSPCYDNPTPPAVSLGFVSQPSGGLADLPAYLHGTKQSVQQTGRRVKEE